MKEKVVFLMLIIFFGGCSHPSKEELNSYLLGSSFLLITEKQDSIQIEFLEKCVKNYSWDYRIDEMWKVIENEKIVLLYFDGGNYELKSKSNNELLFENVETKFKLIRVERDIINLEYLQGKWIEEKHIELLSAATIPPPPCLNFENDSFLIPGVEFREDTCIINDFCNRRKMSFGVNLKFGIIRFGSFCTFIKQWKILSLTKDTMVVDQRNFERVRYQWNLEYERNKKYVKFGT